MSTFGHESLLMVAGELRKPRVRPVSIRTLIGWYGRQHRTADLNQVIHRDLKESGLVVSPDFAARIGGGNYRYLYGLDHTVVLRLVGPN